MSIADVAALIEAKIIGNVETEVENVAPLDQAGDGDVTFLDNTRYLKKLAATQAAACILASKHTDNLPEGVIGLVVAEPYRAYTQLVRHLFPSGIRLQPIMGEWGVISAAAHIHESVQFEEDVTVEAGAVIGPGAEIGRGSLISCGAVVGPGVKIGRDCSIAPHVSVTHSLLGDRVVLHAGARVGQDGFGYAMGPRGHLKLPQVGRVILQDDVDIGANTTIDRGANRDTIIGEGTKIDNQVQIGHNVEIGRHCILVSQSGVSGSTILEDFVIIAGKVGLTGHIRVGMGAQIAGGSQVSNSIPAGEKWCGVPAKPLRAWTREQMTIRKLVDQKTNKA